MASNYKKIVEKEKALQKRRVEKAKSKFQKEIKSQRKLQERSRKGQEKTDVKIAKSVAELKALRSLTQEDRELLKRALARKKARQQERARLKSGLIREGKSLITSIKLGFTKAKKIAKAVDKDLERVLLDKKKPIKRAKRKNNRRSKK